MRDYWGQSFSLGRCWKHPLEGDGGDGRPALWTHSVPVSSTLKKDWKEKSYATCILPQQSKLEKTNQPTNQQPRTQKEPPPLHLHSFCNFTCCSSHQEAMSLSLSLSPALKTGLALGQTGFHHRRWRKGHSGMLELRPWGALQWPLSHGEPGHNMKNSRLWEKERERERGPCQMRAMCGDGPPRRKTKPRVSTKSRERGWLGFSRTSSTAPASTMGSRDKWVKMNCPQIPDHGMVGRPGTGDSSKPWHGEVACLMAIDGETVVQTYALILKNFLSSYSTSTVMYYSHPFIQQIFTGYPRCSTTLRTREVYHRRKGRLLSSRSLHFQRRTEKKYNSEKNSMF